MYGKKKCMKCGKPATHKFTRIENSQIYDLFLCAEHAADLSPYQKPKIPLSDILEGLLKNEYNLKSGSPPAPTDLKCSGCGLSFEQYKKNLILGCSDCYESFREYLISDLRKFHGEIRHMGRMPGGEIAQPPAQKLAFEPLRDELAEPAPKPPEPVAEPDVAESIPTECADPKSELDRLSQTMKKAILDEDYVKAARCRDRIRELREQLETPATEDHSQP